MALKGDLASVDLAQVFQMLALNQKVGLLSIQSPRLWKVLYFDNRGVTLYYNEHTLLDRVLASLVRGGMLLEDAVHDAREHAAQMNTSLLDSLLAGGYLSEKDLERASRLELEEEIYDLFFCRNARFEFFEGATSIEGREGIINERFFFGTDSLIMEAARRIDEWSYIQERISGANEILKATGPSPNISNLDDGGLAVLELVDGKRNIARIVEISGMPKFHVFKHLSILMDEGLVAHVPPDQMVPAASACLEEGRVQDAINLFEGAIAAGSGVPEVHKLTADAYETCQEYEQAVYHLKCDAEYRVASNDLKGAMSSLRRAITMLPTDLAARERLVELTISHHELKNDGFDPLAEGKELVDLYMEIGDLSRVRSILERLVRENPDDLELKKILVNVHTKAGDTARVIELYESMAEDLVRARRTIEAVNYLQKILILDRSRSDISAKVKSLYELDERSRSRRRSLVSLALLFVVLAALGGVYWTYDQHARTKFESLNVAALIEAKEFGRAASVYDQFIKDHPLSMVIKDAEEELARIDSLRKRHEAKVEREKAATQRELAKLRAEYRRAWALHEEQFLNGDPEGSLRSVERVRELVKEAGAEQDMTWALENRVEKMYKRLRDYLAQAAALERSAREKLASGDWQGARSQLLNLVRNYENTKTARSVRLPVMITSRPRGATIFKDGQPVVQKIGGEEKQALTPAVVLCDPNAKEAFAVSRSGFEPQAVLIDAKDKAVVEVVLRVVPASVVTFDEPAQTSAGAGGNHLAVGLRGGLLGLARAGDGRVLHTIKLNDLKAVEGAPRVADGSALFLTNEDTIECYLFGTGRQARGWPVKLPSPPLFDIEVRDGRVFLCTMDQRILAYDQVSGSLVWQAKIGGSAAGPPVLHRRLVRAATTDGDVVVLDASDGQAVYTWRSPAEITTRILTSDGVMFFGCVDGQIRALSEKDGRTVWSAPVGRAIGDGEMALTDSGVVVLGSDNRLLILGQRDGAVLHEAEVTGKPRPGLLVSGDRLLLITRLQKKEATAFYDVLQARDASTLDVLWEYVDGGKFRGQPTVDGGNLFLTDSNGEVVRFQ